MTFKPIHYFGLFIITVVLILGFFYLTQSPNRSHQPNSVVTLEPTLTDAIDTMIEEEKVTQVHESTVLELPNTAKLPDLLQPGVDMETVQAEFDYIAPDRWLNGREFIRFEAKPLQNFEVKQEFTITLPSSTLPYTGIVNTITEFEGIKRLKGMFKGYGEDQLTQFSMTVSDNGEYVAGNFYVDNESYSLEAKNGVGWINHASNEQALLIESEQEFMDEMKQELGFDLDHDHE